MSANRHTSFESEEAGVCRWRLEDSRNRTGYLCTISGLEEGWIGINNGLIAASFGCFYIAAPECQTDHGVDRT